MATLVVHSGGIGDFILSCPAIAALSADAPIELLGIQSRLDLAVEWGFARTAHDFDAVDFGTAFTNPSPRLREFLGAFDRAVVWMRDDGAISRTFRACGIDRVDTYPGLPPDAWPGHASEYYLSCLGLEASSTPPPWPLASTDPFAYSYDIVIHPGSGSPKKNWPLEHFLELAEALTASERNTAWILGPAERDSDMCRSLGDIDVVQASSLVELAHRLAKAKLYIGNDSGITHLAAAVGTPTTAIIGPTDPAIWAPRGTHVKCVRGTPWPELAAILSSI
ncbi:MAG: glycosyltransferase family 9 protein [Planctomycetes bacterium]|nr:glycosyltransferase family 9 protein [Planctomycetota bacterium]